MTAGDSGTVITVRSGQYVMADNSVATLIIQQASIPIASSIRCPLTINPGGLSATYITAGTEFPAGGNYYLSLEVRVGGNKYTSAPVIQHVNPLLPILST